MTIGRVVTWCMRQRAPPAGVSRATGRDLSAMLLESPTRRGSRNGSRAAAEEAGRRLAAPWKPRQQPGSAAVLSRGYSTGPRKAAALGRSPGPDGGAPKQGHSCLGVAPQIVLHSSRASGTALQPDCALGQSGSHPHGLRSVGVCPVSERARS